MAIDSRAIGERICFYRTEAGLSKEQFSAQINLSRKHLYEIESGKCDPSLDTFVIIANALHVSANDLLRDSLLTPESNNHEVLALLNSSSPKIQRILTATIKHLATILKDEDL